MADNVTIGDIDNMKRLKAYKEKCIRTFHRDVEDLDKRINAAEGKSGGKKKSGSGK